MQVHDSKVTKKASSSSSSKNNNNNISNRNRQDNDGNPASVMSSYSLIDDDHIDDQETINVGNLIIDLESDLEKEKIENEQANAKPTSCSAPTTTTGVPSSSTGVLPTSSSSSSSSSVPSSSTSFGTKASSSANSLSVLPIPSGKINQKSSSKHSNISNNNVTSNNNLSNSSTINSSSTSATTNNDNNNNGHVMTSSRTVFKSSADERGELKMRITRETKPGKSEHKIVTSPNHKSPTSCSSSSGNVNNTTGHAHNCDEIIQNESSSISSTKECGTSTSIGTITEPDCLGPCEPGTSVTLEGIVWQETDGGILVVNVTWRGKTYVGALLDCTKHDWAPPRLCDSPASDIDSKAHKGVRTKRIVTRSNGIGLDEKNLLQTTGKLRNGKGRRILNSNELASCNKRQRELEKSNENIAAQAEPNTSMTSVSSITNSETACVSMNIDTAPAANNESISTSNISTDKAGPNSPMLIGCSEPNCSKKYRNMNGLLYHQTHAHSADNDSNNVQEDNCSSSLKDDKQIKTSRPVSEEGQEMKDEPMEADDRQSPALNEPKQEVKVDHAPQETTATTTIMRKRTPSPQLSHKLGSNKDQIMAPNNNFNSNTVLNQEPPRTSVVKSLELERRNSSNSNHSISNIDHGSRRSPGAPRHLPEHGHGSNNHSSSKSSSSSSSKHQSNLPPLPATTEEGMKPSGTTTGPPPAPHSANYYFNSPYLANQFNPYTSMAPYFPRPPLPLYDPIAPPTSTANALLSRFMSNMRAVGPPPPSESPSRLLSPSMQKNLPFPPFKVEPGAMPPLPPPPMVGPPPLPNMSPLTNPPPPLTSGSPLLRMPSQVDPMMPPTSQPPFPPPAGMNPALGLRIPMNPMGPLGGPQMPSLVDDPLAKQFPRRFN